MDALISIIKIGGKEVAESTTILYMAKLVA
jgi:hypothetical protein